MNLLKYLFAFCLLAGINSCVDPFDFALPKGKRFLVVDGNFTSANRAHQVKLYYTTDNLVFGDQVLGKQIPIENAALWLVDSDNNKERYRHIILGVYEVAGTEIKGIVGAEYHLEIELADGTEYQSIPEKMPPLIKGNNLQLEFETKQKINIENTAIEKKYIVAYVNTSLPTDADYSLRWDVVSMYSFPEWQCSPLAPPAKICYIQQIPNEQRINLLSSKNFNASSVERLEVGDKLLTPSEFEFRGKYYFLVNQQSITEKAHTYWSNINLVANQSGSIFDPPPAAVKGNLYNPNDETETVLGYFELMQTDSLRSYITKSDLSDFYKFPTQVCPSFTNRALFPFEEACCNCEVIEDSSLERPTWW